ncbi:Protein CBG18159 [Caenorhabditis briggsae]|uniref:Tyrosine-protein kinase n=1 Tax=Caenorhabditis briggsae TaxID=6238 RepID=A8XT57_CAEBR|nr:Protein CBG18159 [Caenorhabditis briggsae]CAP35660.2 Protein CBG18159 [Caenorhabditis briggsae]
MHQNSALKIEFIRKGESPSDLEFSDNVGQVNSDQISDCNSTGSIPDNQSGISDMEKSVDDYISNILKHHLWYHGMMFGGTVEKLLKWEHSYLVRRAIQRSSMKKTLCISVKIDGKVLNFQLTWNEDGWGSTKLVAKFPKMAQKRYAHIYQLLDAWSLSVNAITPVPRNRIVLHHSSITLGNKLGSGAFGEVYRAKYLPNGASESIEVAVKRAIGDAQRSTIQEFCHEAQVMGVLQHVNIVCLYGIASLEQPVMLVMELVTGGDLRLCREMLLNTFRDAHALNFEGAEINTHFRYMNNPIRFPNSLKFQKHLQTTHNISHRQLITFAADIASGMKHMAQRRVIHRDLAARNCLITNSLKIKISDFGLSHSGQEVIVKKLKKAPIRWLAPETLQKGIFNEKTDVWSYGVLLTEIINRCATDPLAPRTLKEVQEWIKESDHPHRIKNGEPKELADLVDICCDKNSITRPNFQTVRRRIRAILETANMLGPISGTLEMKKSEERKSSTSTDRKVSNTALMRKKSRDGKVKDRSTERKGGTQRRIVSHRRREIGPMKLPIGMSTPEKVSPQNMTSPATPPIPKT